MLLKEFWCNPLTALSPFQQNPTTNVSTFPVLWGVINNAGIAYFGEVEWLSVAIYQEVLDVNLLGMIRVTQQFLPHLRQSKGLCILKNDSNYNSVLVQNFTHI